MPKYVIERELPGAGNLSALELQGISQKSCSVLRKLGPQVQWVHSYVTQDKIYCVYIAPDENAVREHAAEQRAEQDAEVRGGKHGAERRVRDAPFADDRRRRVAERLHVEPVHDQPEHAEDEHSDLQRSDSAVFENVSGNDMLTFQLK